MDIIFFNTFFIRRKYNLTFYFIFILFVLFFEGNVSVTAIPLRLAGGWQPRRVLTFISRPFLRCCGVELLSVGVVKHRNSP